VVNPASWPLVAGIGVLWAAAPLIVWRISTPARAQRERALTFDERAAFRMVARRTWRYFETFVSDDHPLPPDNFQQAPDAVVARRTSPTNIGLSLLSTTVAHDFGWIGVLDLADHLERTLDTVDRLQTFRGHLLNWYDTSDLRALEPQYVSTVDSGNLAGHLLAIAQACREAADNPVLPQRALDGIRDAALLARDAAADPSHPARSDMVNADHLRAAAQTVLVLAERSLPSPDEWQDRLASLGTAAHDLLDVARTLHPDGDDPTPGAPEGPLVWPTAVRDCVATHQRDAAAGVIAVDGPGAVTSPTACTRWRSAPRPWSRRWTSGSCSTNRATSCRSATACPTPPWIPVATTCWHPRPGWPASSPSPRPTCHRSTGSAWAASSPRSGAARRWCRGPGRCSNTSCRCW
jgi:cyclic beta-1,2-glucan synthetase